jgi:hypothetical protein
MKAGLTNGAARLTGTPRGASLASWFTKTSGTTAATPCSWRWTTNVASVLTMNSAAFAAFLVALPYAPGTNIVLDNCSIHKTRVVRDSAHAKGYALLFTPPYSPDPSVRPFGYALRLLKTVGSYHTALLIVHRHFKRCFAEDNQPRKTTRNIFIIVIRCTFTGKPYMDGDPAGMDLENQTIGQLDALVKAMKKKSLHTSLRQDETKLMNRARAICRRKIIGAPVIWGQGSGCDICIRG